MTTRTDTREELRPRQQRAIVALLQYRSVQEAAQATNTPVSTLYRWLRSEPFRAALLAAEGDLVDETTRRLTALAGAAVDALEATLTPVNPPAIRLRAAQSALDYLLRLRELRDLEQRLTALEAHFVRDDSQGDE